MIWNSLSDFINMGGYGIYVWGSFFSSLFLIGLEVFICVKNLKTIIKKMPYVRSISK